MGAKIFGGTNAYTPVSGAGIDAVSDSLQLCNPKVQIFGQDILVEYDVQCVENG
jgi:riboflavin biosynthesis pyrimidine reductase